MPGTRWSRSIAMSNGGTDPLKVTQPLVPSFRKRIPPNLRSSARSISVQRSSVVGSSRRDHRKFGPTRKPQEKTVSRTNGPETAMGHTDWVHRPAAHLSGARGLIRHPVRHQQLARRRGTITNKTMAAKAPTTDNRMRHGLVLGSARFAALSPRRTPNVIVPGGKGLQR